MTEQKREHINVNNSGDGEHTYVNKQKYREALEKIRDDAEQVVLRDGHAIPQDIYILTRRIFIRACEALK